MIAVPAITVEQRFWFNPELTSRSFLVPGSIAIVMTLVGTLLTSLVVAREWERGTMEAMMATPVTGGRAAGRQVVALFPARLDLGDALRPARRLRLRRAVSGLSLAALTPCGRFPHPRLGQGLLISAVTKNQFLASQLALISAFLPAFLLSGFLFEINSMPDGRSSAIACSLCPPGILSLSLQTVFLAGDIWPLFLQAIAIMFAHRLHLLPARRAVQERGSRKMWWSRLKALIIKELLAVSARSEEPLDFDRPADRRSFWSFPCGDSRKCATSILRC